MAEAITTGSIRLDHILGGEGVPSGTIVEVFGGPDAGKSSFALQLVHSVQSRSDGGEAVYIDTEHALDPGYADRIGVDLDSLVFSQPDSGEQALDIARKMAESGAVKLIVIDSAAALVPEKEREERFDEDRDMRQSKLLARGLRRLAPRIEQAGAVLLFTNQLRTRVDASFGPDETTPGGNALKFYTSIRIRMDPEEPIEKGGQMAGTRVRIQVVKNRTAPPNRSVVVDLLYDRGICPYGDLLDAGLQEKIVQSDPSWTFRGEQLGTSREEVRRRLESSDDLRTALREEVVKAYSQVED